MRTLSIVPMRNIFRASPCSKVLSVACFCLLVTCAGNSALAQAKPPKLDLLADNGGFEKAESSSENLWDGVNSDGTLTGFNYSPLVLTENGSFSAQAVPPSVAFVDLNGDGKPDLITADPTGFFRFYPNSGTATAPKFTYAELIPIFVSSTYELHAYGWGTDGDESRRMCPRFALADWRHSGLMDLVIGNYFGEVLFLPNMGTAAKPVFRTPAAPEFRPPDPDRPASQQRSAPSLGNPSQVGIMAARIPTDNPDRLWANLLAPAACNFSNGTQPDLLLGEGTYSANSIHFLPNAGGDRPKLSNVKHTVLAYGEGREQLVPTVADFNGDGNADLVIGDRTGEIGLYLSPGKPNPDVQLKRTATLSFGGTSKLEGAVAPFAADFNGDGLMDLLIGLPNGHIAVALNTGTKTEPKFAPPVELKGTPKFGRNVKLPSIWKIDTFRQFGNALGYFTVVNAQDDPEAKAPEGANCLKAGYWPLTGQTFPMPENNIPGTIKHFMLIHEGLTLNANRPYKLSFKVKGVGMEALHYELTTHFRGRIGTDKIERDERGGAKHSVEMVDEEVHLGNTFTAGPNWTTVDTTVVPKYRSIALRNEATLPMNLVLEFYGTTVASKIYFDDFHLVEE